MKNNNWLKYFLYAVVLICYITLSDKMIVFLTNQYYHFTIGPSLLLLVKTIIFIIVGLLLGLESLILETRKEGKWKVNLPKVIFLGLPSLYFSIGTLIYFYCPIAFVQVTLCYPIRHFFDGNFLTVFQIILGYTICTSLSKIKD